MHDGGADSTAHAGDDTGGVVARDTARDPPRLGRYRIGDRLGAGGMGVVYLAYDPTLDRQVAVKVLRRSTRDRGHLEREAQAIARIHHPNVVVVHDVITDGADVCVVMQYVRGTTLAEWLAAGARPPREILARFLAAGRGLAAAHAAGLVHRDFKPENVLLGDDGAVVVTDFGLARLDATSHEDVDDPDEELHLAQTRSGSLSGTPRYMSPEQFRGDLIEARSDQFNFAVALWLALFKTHPLIPPGAAPTIEEHRALVLQGTILAPRDARVVPSRILAALRRALAVDPAARFPTMEVFLAELAPRQRGRVLAVAGAGALAAGLAFAGATGRIGSDRRPAAVPGARACGDAAAPIAAVWDAAARQRYLARAADPQLQPLIAADALAFDRFAAAWSESARAECAAPDPRRAACLADQRDQLAAALTRTSLRGQPLIGDPAWCASGGVHVAERMLRTSAGSGAFSPDGTQIAYATDDGAHTIVGIDGHAIGTGPAMATITEWTANGIEGYDATGKPQRAQPGEPVAAVADGDLLSRLAHDGKRRARVRAEVLEIVDAAGTVVSTIHIPGATYPHSWSPDDRRLLVGATVASFYVVDLATGGVSEIPRLFHNTTGWASGEWRGPDEIIMPGGIGGALGDGLWRVRLDDKGAVADIAAIVAPVRNRGVNVLDVHGDRALVRITHLAFATMRVHGGHATPMGAPVEGVLGGSDVARGRFAVATDDGTLHVIDLDGRLVQRGSVRGAALRNGELVRFVRTDDSRVELRREDGQVLATSGPGIDSVLRVSCNAGGTGWCAAIFTTAAGPELRAIGPAGFGPAVPFPMPDYFTSISISADGARVVITRNAAAYDVVDTARGTRRTVDVPECRVQDAVAEAGDEVVFAGICDDHQFQLRRSDGHGHTSPIVTTDEWISGVDDAPGGDYMITTRAFNAALVLLEGLPPAAASSAHAEVEGDRGRVH